MSPVLQNDLATPAESETGVLPRAVDQQQAPRHSPLADAESIAQWKPSPEPGSSCSSTFCTARAEAEQLILPKIQARWASRPLVDRLQAIRQARHWIASHAELFANAIAPDLARSEADTLVAEVRPLLDAMRFLERNAPRILAPRKLGSSGRPFWLSGVKAEIRREPLGHILVIGPANFPLFLPGTQVLQALVAGNAVTWKPGAGGEKVALLLAHALQEAGLPRGVLRITPDSVEAAHHALKQQPNKVVFTGSFETGRRILRDLVETATPAVMELSGADAVVVLPSADLAAAAKAIAFGLRLNGGEVCMSPRRVIATGETLTALRPLLTSALSQLAPVTLKPQIAKRLKTLLQEAISAGATLANTDLLGAEISSGRDRSAKALATLPLVVDRATPEMEITRTDLFAPVLSIIESPSVLHIPGLVNDNPYGLTAAIFGNPAEAESIAAELRVGTVLINDLIAPTADPRIPFGGRSASGFGLTRGAEGLLEMTAAKAVLRRRKPVTRHYDPLTSDDLPMLTGLLRTLHGGSLRERWGGFQRLLLAVRSRSR